MKPRLALCTVLALLGACRVTDTPAAPQVLVLKGNDFGSRGTTVTLRNVGANESVAVLPVYAAQSLAPDAVQYRVTPTGLTAPAAAQNVPAARAAPSPEQRRLQEHLAHLEENRRLAQKLRRAGVKPLGQGLSPTDLGTNCPAPYTVGGTVCDFYVDPAGDVEEALVNATLRFESANAYWFIDNAYANELSQEELVRMGQIFEDELVPVDTQYFGNFPDADGNGKIFIVFSSLEAYGYVTYLDLFDDDAVVAQFGVHSNEGDIFYARLPSDNVRDGRTREQYFAADLPSTLVHELKHLIAGGIRLQDPNAQLEPIWAEEASAVAAEELSPYGSAETRYAQGQAENSLKEPENFRVISKERGTPQEGSYYGYNFLLFWRIAERVGHENFWKGWTAGPETGVANLERNAPALGSFADMMADWSMALMFSNTGLVSGYDYSKLNLRDGTWQPLAYRPLTGPVTGSTRSLAAYVGQGTGQDVTLTLETNDLTPYAVVVRFTGTLPY